VTADATQSLDAWVPRSLLQLSAAEPVPIATAEGLTPMRLRWRDGRLLMPQPLPEQQKPPCQLVLPRLVDPHVHLDKAFTWSAHPNLSGTYGGALAANLEEHQQRTEAAVLERAERALQLACARGLRAVRSHIDSLGPGAEPSWQALLQLRERWRDRLTLQLVALVPIDHWGTPAGETLARRVAAAGGLLGGVLVPPCRGPAVRQSLRGMLRLAQQLGCGIDLHIDESDWAPAAGLRQLLRVLERDRPRLSITCSHASSLGLLSDRPLQRICRRMAAFDLRVAALPLTNGWLLARRPGCTPVVRPLAPIHQLQRAGVCVAVGGDNVADPWFPAGGFDPIALMASSLPLTQLAPWQRLGLAPFTTAGAALMDLAWDGVIREGAPADLMLLEAASWSEALMSPPARRILIAGQWWRPPTR
jgi:cytosine deaminase